MPVGGASPGSLARRSAERRPASWHAGRRNVGRQSGRVRAWDCGSHTSPRRRPAPPAPGPPGPPWRRGRRGGRARGRRTNPRGEPITLLEGPALAAGALAALAVAPVPGRLRTAGALAAAGAAAFGAPGALP